MRSARRPSPLTPVPIRKRACRFPRSTTAVHLRRLLSLGLRCQGSRPKRRRQGQAIALLVPEPATFRSGRSSGRGLTCDTGCDGCRPGCLADAGVPRQRPSRPRQTGLEPVRSSLREPTSERSPRPRGQVQQTGRPQFGQHSFVELLPHAGLVSVLQPTPARRTRSAEHGGR